MAAFTAVATGVGLAVTAGTTIASFAQAAEQNQKKKQAEEEAAKAYDETLKSLDVNYYEQLSIQKEPYELARRELLSQGALATQKLAEGDARALAGGVGRVQLAQQAGQEKVATAMQQEKTALDRLIAGEDSRLRDVKGQLKVQEAMGAQQAAADAAKAEAMAISQGMAGVTSLAGQVASLAPLYEKSAGANAANRFDKLYSGAKGGASSQDFMRGVDPSSLSMNNDQISILNKAGSIGNMSAAQYKDFMSGFSPEQTRGFMKAAGVEPTQNLFYNPNKFKDPKLKYTVPPEYQGGTAGSSDLPGMYYDSGVDFNSQDPFNVFNFDKTLVDRPPYANYGQSAGSLPNMYYDSGIDFYSADPFNIYK